MSAVAAAVQDRPRARVRTVVGAVVAAGLVNLVVYAVGRLAGGDFTFTRDDGRATVDAATVAGFTAVPLGAGLALVGLLADRLRWVPRVAAVVAPLLAVATILVMTVPVDLDAVSTATLATCHLTLVPVSLLAIRRLRR